MSQETPSKNEYFNDNRTPNLGQDHTDQDNIMTYTMIQTLEQFLCCMKAKYAEKNKTTINGEWIFESQNYQILIILQIHYWINLAWDMSNMFCYHDPADINFYFIFPMIISLYVCLKAKRKSKKQRKISVDVANWYKTRINDPNDENIGEYWQRWKILWL